jgi:hypothetical protein
MSQIAYPSIVTSLSNQGDFNTAWDGSITQVGLAPGNGGYVRKCDMAVTDAFEALHDGCVVTNIRVEFTGSRSGSYPSVYAYAQFLSVAAVTSDLAFSNTLYWAEGGAGTLPSAIRAAVLESSCRNDGDFYSVTVTMSMPVVTVFYTDNGMPQMMQFSL